jgi:hypothetical protein
MRRHIYDKSTTILFISVLLFAHTACKSSSGRMKSPSRPNNNANKNRHGGGGGILGGVGDENEIDYEDDYYFIQELKNNNKSNNTTTTNNLQRRIVPDEQRLMTKILRGYDTASRPVYNASTPVIIEFGFSLVQIFDMVIISIRFKVLV